MRDGANNNLGLDQISKVPTVAAAITAMQTPLSMGIGGPLDCGSTQPRRCPGCRRGIEIWVSVGSATDNAFYDVWATLKFQ